MNKYKIFLSPFALGLVVLFTLTSCGDIEQNLIIRADGSGTLETSFDIGEMMSMMQGFGDAAMEDVTISSEEGMGVSDTTQIVEEKPKDPMTLLMEKVTKPDYNLDFDTLISFLSIMPDSVKQKETRLDLVKKIDLHMKSPAKSSDLIVGIRMNFDHAAQLRELVTYMEQMDQSNTASAMGSAGPGGLQSENFLVFEADLKAGWIRFDSVDYTGMAAEFGMTGDSLMGGEDLGMVEMMFGGSKMRSIIHVPGEVTSCTNKNAILTKDDRVIIEYGFVDLMKKGRADGFTIYFNPKK